jgi:hypothetical protein
MESKIITLFLVLSSLVLAQTTSQDAPMPEDHTGHQTMPGMQHNMPGMPQMENPAQKTGTQTPAPDLLKDVASHPTMRLEDFQQFALSTNPTLRQATTLVRQSAGQARQAGLYPNPSVGYQGEQIRDGSYGGGEQGAFVQQTFVLGGKLGVRCRSEFLLRSSSTGSCQGPATAAFVGDGCGNNRTPTGECRPGRCT